MKKILFFVVTVVFAACFTSCDNGNKFTIDTKDAEIATALTIYDGGPIDFRFPGLHQFLFEGYTETINYDPETNELEGSGFVFQVSQALSFADANTPIATKYTPFEIVDDAVAEIYSGGAVGIALYTVENGQIVDNVNTYDFLVEVQQANGKMTIALKANFDGEEKVFKFEGTPAIYNQGDYTTEDVEPTEAYKGDVKFDQAEAIYYGAEEDPSLPLNVIEVILVDKKQETFADIFCYGSLDNEKNVYGTFKVSTKHEVGTAAQSAGLFIADDGNAYPSPSFIVLNSEDYYLVKDGEITVEDGKITFDLTTINGSQISTTYEGDIKVASFADTYKAPRAKAPALKRAKQNAEPFNYNPIVKF